MNPHSFFYIALLFILIHEMDAVRCKEWRMIPLLSKLDDKKGSVVFILAHIPIYSFFFCKLVEQPINAPFIYGLNIFFIGHLLVHLLLLKHKENAFKDWVSWTLIFGAALFGFIDILLE